MILGIGMLIGCSAEKPTDCHCTARYKNVNTGNSFYVENEPIFCDTQRPIHGSESADVWFLGCVNHAKPTANKK